MQLRAFLAAMALLMAMPPLALAHERSNGEAPPETVLSASARGPAAIVDAFHLALHRGDILGAAALLAEDALIFEEGGAERSKAEYAAHHLPADAAFSKVVASTILRRSGGAAGNVAWIATEARLTGIHEGKAVGRLTTETMLLRRTKNGWKITHVHWSSRAAK